MTYDERQEIAQYLDIVKKNCDRLSRSIELMQNALGEIACRIGELKDDEKSDT